MSQNLHKAVYPGSFDPITLGHVDIIKRIAKVFSEVTVVVADSNTKNYLFSVEERQQMIEKSISHLPNVNVDVHSGLTVDYVQKIGAQVIVRGLRAVVDFEYEMAMASMNKTLNQNVETMLVFASPEYYYVSSRMIKEVARFNGELTNVLPHHVVEKLKAKMNQKSV